VIFLLGAGASIDAGMPSVTDLAGELRRRLPGVRDINGQTCRKFLQLFDAIAECDPEARNNYERFFEWLLLFIQVQREPYRRAIGINFGPDLAEAAAPLAFVIKQPTWKILSERHQSTTYQPDYLANLGHFLPQRGRLKVFTLNYDLCVEDACRAQGIDVATGFLPGVGTWSPSQFHRLTAGINLYKLHGSINWSPGGDLPDQGLIERYPADWSREPELLLGPRSKLQHDDPYVTLYSEFHDALRHTTVCVAIGCSFRDDHVRWPVREAGRRGMKTIDVNPSSVEWVFEGYKEISMGTKEAFESNAIRDAIEAAGA
jgi:hypothetical protein